MIEHIEKSIRNAIAGASSLPKAVLDIPGMSSHRNRHLLNNLVRDEDNYLEIGVHRGSTFISALYGKKIGSAYAVDDWSLFASDNSRAEFVNNCMKFGIHDFKFIEKDCFMVTDKDIAHKINVFFYDGEHYTEPTQKSLTHYYPFLADEFLYIVDDYDWDIVRTGVVFGLDKCNLEVIHKVVLQSGKTNDADGWWNGIGIFYLKKKI